MHQTKKWLFSISMIAVALWGLTWGELIDLSNCTNKTFKVTAYYSPQPDQQFYYRGNFDDEVILNGRGVAGASGQPVYNGMVAAPISYTFGTKVFLPGFGIGEVQDRGGAIVHEGERGEEYDRIDIRAGRGEEGLMRALSFGVQYIDGFVCDESISPRVGFDYEAFPSYENFFARSLWIMQLWEGREDPWVEVLQGFLAGMGYLESDKVTGYFGPLTKQAVCNFQQQALGLSPASLWCGYFGPQTRSALLASVKTNGITPLSPQQDAGPRIAATTSSVDTTEKSASISDIEHDFTDETEANCHHQEDDQVELAQADDEQPLVDVTPVQVEPEETRVDVELNRHYLEVGDSRQYQFLDLILLGDSGREVKLLQRKLQRLGYYKKEITGVYDLNTLAAVFALQLEHGIVTRDDDPNLHGYFGPETRKTVNAL